MNLAMMLIPITQYMEDEWLLDAEACGFEGGCVAYIERDIAETRGVALVLSPQAQAHVDRLKTLRESMRVEPRNLKPAAAMLNERGALLGVV